MPRPSCDGRPHLKTIRSRILVFAILATLVPALGLGVLSFGRYDALISDDIAHELSALARDVDGELKLWQRERAAGRRMMVGAFNHTRPEAQTGAANRRLPVQ